MIYPYRLLLILLIIGGIPSGSKGQSAEKLIRLHSVVTDSISGNPVTHASVTILFNGEKHAAVSTSQSGSFSIQLQFPGDYLLQVSAIGFELKEITCKITDTGITPLPEKILLTPAAEKLQSVTVTGRKKLFESKPGKLIYHAGNDATNKGGSAADVLRKAPVLNVDAQGNVSMRGSKNLKILVNGKYSGQIARSPADALNMMPADMIQSVEVITTPSAKYDAEGAAGVINIITKKGKKEFSGALELTGSNLEKAFNPRITYNKGKWGITANGHIHRLRTKETTVTNRTQLKDGLSDGTLQQEQKNDNTAPHGSGDLAISFTPDSSQELNFGANYWYGKWPDNREQHTAVKNAHGTITEQYLQSTTARENYLGADFNLGYTRKFKKEGQELNLLAQLSPSGSKSPYHTWLFESGQAKPFYEELNQNKTTNREYTIQADYVHPLLPQERLTVETGIKGIFRKVYNNYETKVGNPSMGTGPLTDPLRSDRFDYSQDVWAAYVMMKSNLKNDWYLETGLRMERTEIKGRFASNSTTFSNQFTNFIPNATLSKKIDETQQLSISYTQRLTRPYIWDLNPNTDASDPKNLHRGNPGLQPETMHQAELVYAYNKGSRFFLNTSLFWKQTDDAIMDFTSTNINGVSTTSKQNLATNRMYGVNFSSSVTLSSMVTLNGNLNINHLEFNSDALQILNDGWAFDLDLNMSCKLPKRFTVQAFGEYNSRKVTLQGRDAYWFDHSVAVKKELPDQRLTITAAAINPFSPYISQRVTTLSTSFHSTVDYRFYLHAFKLTLNWEFGNMFKQKEKKKIVNDDVRGQSKE